ncbi:J domain-containing protein [Microbacterium sp. zg-YB36]|uniref:J domain-containing protein n=1 Tax=Microbacterium sp. zg-YB36 TaxID=2969407 RepID=UPI00214B2FA6|nr:J domain-containing protein [Microbacterium sp. zg-YB36]MDL5351449.1 J domain-containing protein [Microbacterium sp. zg-YB36]
MTLEEARSILNLERGASREEIRKAFQRRAREAHPDRHPGADERARAHHAHEFDRAREARDILLLLVPEPGQQASRGFPAAAGQTQTPRQAPPASKPPPPASPPPQPGTRRAARAQRPQPAATDRPPRTTLRFDEFVRQTDAGGFGPGVNSRPYHDVVRIVVWSGLALVVCGFAAAIAVASGW